MGNEEARHTDPDIIFAPAGELVPLALKAVAKGGVVVCGGIYMTDIPSSPYEDLWGERVIRSVANLTRQDGVEHRPGEIGDDPAAVRGEVGRQPPVHLR